MEDRKKSGYGNLGDDTKGLQKIANEASGEKYRAEVLKEFAAEMDGHEMKRLPSSGSPLNHLQLPKKEEIREKEPTPLDWDDRLEKWIRE